MKNSTCVRSGGRSRRLVLAVISVPEGAPVGTGGHVARGDEILTVTSSESSDEERKLLAAVEKWKIVIEDARPKTGRTDVGDHCEREPLPEPTRAFWRRPWFVAGASVAGTLTLAGLLYLRRAGGHSHHHPVSSVSYDTTHVAQPDPTVSTVSSYATSVVQPDPTVSMASSHATSVVQPDTLVRLLPTMRGRWQDEISERELATLKTPMDACESAHRKVKAGSTRAGMREATKKGWQQLDWSDCSDYGGKLVCTGGYNTDDGNLQCHYFATPWVYDLPTVWELIVRYLKPTQCSYQCNDEDEHEKLLTVRRGVEIASSIPGVDLDSASAQELYTLGKAVPLHLEYKDTGNMRVACDSYSPHLVTCDESTCWSNVQTPSGNVMNWGYVTGFHDGPPLPLCYSGAIREGYEINDWLCECYEVDSGWEENVQQAWNEIVHARQMSDH